MEFQQQHPDGPDHFHSGTTLWTVACSTLGGIYKVQATPHLLLSSLTLDGSLSVATYAFMSAVVGYGTKKLLDYLFAKLKKE